MNLPLSTAQKPTYGILGQSAPSWQVTQWAQLPAGQTELDVSTLKGKVIYLYCFQSWCPGCHKFGFPTLKHVHATFKDQADVRFVTVQTTFEGFEVNQFSKAQSTVQDYNLEIPVGQSGLPDKRSALMAQYRTGGTPWTVIIDKKGVVRYNDFHIQPDQAVTLIKQLQAEESASAPSP